MADSEPYKIVMNEEKDSLRVAIHGNIDKDFQWPEIPKGEGKRVFVNLENVHYMNSVGMKKWITNFPFQKASTEFVNVSVTMMDLFNMVPAAYAGCPISSFYLPVFCQKCEEKFELVRTEDIDLQDVSNFNPLFCSCGRRYDIETDLDSYLTCLRPQSKPV